MDEGRKVMIIMKEIEMKKKFIERFKERFGEKKEEWN